MNIILLLGTLLGLSSIMMAAYIDHSLALHLSAGGASLNALMKAVRYHQLYAVVIGMIGLVVPLQNHIRMKSWLTRSACIFLIGIILFSFSIYISALVGSATILYFTPVGGVLLMLGWVVLMRAALLKLQ